MLENSEIVDSQLAATDIGIGGIADLLLESSEWCRQKLEQYPNDDRNTKAAVELERLASQVASLNDDNPLIIWYRILVDEDTDDYGRELFIRQSELNRSIGFSASFESAEDYLEDLLRGFDPIDENPVH